MKTESFVIDEAPVDAGEHECTLALVNKLGLDKQRDLFEGDGAAARQLPFRPMTHAEYCVWTILLPHRQKVADFGKEPIPLRVLEVLEKAMQISHFNVIEVWSPKEQRADPLLVGVHWENGKEYRRICFALARWGDVLENWSKLVQRARDKYLARLQTTLQHVQADIEQCKRTDFETLRDPEQVAYHEFTTSQFSQ